MASDTTVGSAATNVSRREERTSSTSTSQASPLNAIAAAPSSEAQGACSATSGGYGKGVDVSMRRRQASEKFITDGRAASTEPSSMVPRHGSQCR